MLRQRGVPHLRGRGRGDLRARVRVEVPLKLTDREAELLAEFAEGRGEVVGHPEGRDLLPDQVGVLVTDSVPADAECDRRRCAATLSAAHVVVDDVGTDDDAVVVLDDDVEHHLRRVLRLRAGEA